MPESHRSRRLPLLLACAAGLSLLGALAWSRRTPQAEPDGAAPRETRGPTTAEPALRAPDRGPQPAPAVAGATRAGATERFEISELELLQAFGWDVQPALALLGARLVGERERQLSELLSLQALGEDIDAARERLEALAAIGLAPGQGPQLLAWGQAQANPLLGRFLARALLTDPEAGLPSGLALSRSLLDEASKRPDDKVAALCAQQVLIELARGAGPAAAAPIADRIRAEMETARALEQALQPGGAATGQAAGEAPAALDKQSLQRIAALRSTSEQHLAALLRAGGPEAEGLVGALLEPEPGQGPSLFAKFLQEPLIEHLQAAPQEDGLRAWCRAWAQRRFEAGLSAKDWDLGLVAAALDEQHPDAVVVLAALEAGAQGDQRARIRTGLARLTRASGDGQGLEALRRIADSETRLQPIESADSEALQAVIGTLATRGTPADRERLFGRLRSSPPIEIRALLAVLPDDFIARERARMPEILASLEPALASDAEAGLALQLLLERWSALDPDFALAIRPSLGSPQPRLREACQNALALRSLAQAGPRDERLAALAERLASADNPFRRVQGGRSFWDLTASEARQAADAGELAALEPWLAAEGNPLVFRLALLRGLCLCASPAAARSAAPWAPALSGACDAALRGGQAWAQRLLREFWMSVALWATRGAEGEALAAEVSASGPARGDPNLADLEAAMALLGQYLAERGAAGFGALDQALREHPAWSAPEPLAPEHERALAQWLEACSDAYLSSRLESFEPRAAARIARLWLARSPERAAECLAWMLSSGARSAQELAAALGELPPDDPLRAAAWNAGQRLPAERRAALPTALTQPER